jgi:hypothetical protein
MAEHGRQQEVHGDLPPHRQALRASPDPGTTVCATHGGEAPQVREAAQRRVAEQQAREIARKIDVDMERYDGNPFEALRDLLRRDQAEMERFARLASRPEDREVTYTTRSGAEQLRAVLSAYRDERDALGRRLYLLLRAGVAQRMMEVREAQHKVEAAGTLAIFGHCLTLFAGMSALPCATRAPTSSMTRS